LEVVIACPGDVQKEKKLVKESIYNVNILAKHLNIEFDGDKQPVGNSCEDFGLTQLA